MKCNKCSQEIPDNSKFCLHCGTKVELTDSIVCPKCGYKNPSDARFCTECGHTLIQNVEKLIVEKNNLFQSFLKNRLENVTRCDDGIRVSQIDYKEEQQTLSLTLEVTCSSYTTVSIDVYYKEKKQNTNSVKITFAVIEFDPLIHTKNTSFTIKKVIFKGNLNDITKIVVSKKS